MIAGGIVDQIPEQTRIGAGVPLTAMDPVAILSELSDNPSEAIAFALAHAVFELRSDSKRLLLCINEADAILTRLRLLGFDVVPILTAAS